MAVVLFALACSGGGAHYAAVDLAGHATALPTHYDEGRFFVRPVTASGDTLDLYTDTGGGLWLTGAVADSLKLPKQIAMIRNGKDTTYAVQLPAFKPDASIPVPLASPGHRVNIFPAMMVMAQMRQSSIAHWSGMLGQEWFAGRMWTFDYPRGTLLLHAPGDTLPHDPAHTVHVGFQHDTGVVHGLNFPRIRVSIDGDSLDLLFDTGAMTTLTDSALHVIDDGHAAERATSFIARSVYERWHAKHPDWRVIERAESGTGLPMIEVPHVSVGGYTVGPVWFTMRADRNFHDYMTQFMDRRIEGALGGSALHYFRVTVDYPHSIALFERS
ncbi:MAG TPA: hypothetical protein VFJ96_00025 [Gemmatimonadaceae bacterium]|jgi:hypothetical protein|nr:hypothetical protein [Gemmatimonadaceae bacterium]